MTLSTYQNVNKIVPSCFVSSKHMVGVNPEQSYCANIQYIQYKIVRI